MATWYTGSAFYQIPQSYHHIYGFEVWGAHFMSESSVFFIMAGWIAEVLFMLFFANIGV